MKWGANQLEVEYSSARVRVRASKAGAAWMVLAAMEMTRARASLVMKRPIVDVVGLGREVGYGRKVQLAC